MSDTQDEPRMEQHTATDRERIDGIIAQVRADVTGENAPTVEHALRRRLENSGLALDEERIDALVAEIAED